MSVRGVKSCASAAIAACSVASVQACPCSAASAPRGALHVAAMPPKARRTSAMRSPCSRRLKPGADGGDVAVKALADLVGRTAWPGTARGTSMPAQTPRLQAGSSCSRCRSRAAAGGALNRPGAARWAPSAISTGAESPIGEPLARLPPIVPARRTGRLAKRSHHFAQRRPLGGQRGPGVLQEARRRCSMPSSCARCGASIRPRR
jgi:hypothetical protein